MQKNQHLRSYSTARAGLVLDIQAASLSTALCRNGHYCGVVPARLPNGRLLWPADEIDALVAGARADEAPDTGARLAAARNAKAVAERSKGGAQ